MRAVDPLATQISRNLDVLRERVARAAATAGRPVGDIRIIAVSKTQPRQAVAAAIAAGHRVFGENTIQDALTKIPHFSDGRTEWHFIGHLQSNKAKFIPGNFQWLHSLDSISLARRIARCAAEQSKIIKCLIEINITECSAKHGIRHAHLPELIDAILSEDGLSSNIALSGLMCIGPHPAAAAEIRAAFARLRRLRDDIQKTFSLSSFTELSMGMSGDYMEAIQEGATQIRVGTAIFGERAYLNR